MLPFAGQKGLIGSVIQVIMFQVEDLVHIFKSAFNRIEYCGQTFDSNYSMGVTFETKREKRASQHWLM